MADLSGFDSWKRGRSEGRRGRRTRLAVVGTLGLATLAALGYALFEPFTRPDVHLFAVQLGNPATAESLPPGSTDFGAVRYAARDSAAFQRIADRVHRYAPDHPAPLISTAERSTDVKSLGRRLIDVTPGSGNVLILYLSSTGISTNGEAWLEWPSSDPDAGPQRLRVADVLEQIRRSPARMKVLLLDAGDRAFSVRDSEVANRFTPLLKAAVATTNDTGLWVLVSHSALETSHVSYRDRRSFFSLAVTGALNGAADRDGNGQIEIGELYRFVAANVSENVRRATGHSQSQTPVLCWGGGNPTNQRLAARLLPTLKKNGDAEPGDAATTAALFPDDITAKSAGEWLTPADARVKKAAVPELPAILASLTPDSQAVGPDGPSGPRDALRIPGQATSDQSRDSLNPARPAEVRSGRRGPTKNAPAGTSKPATAPAAKVEPNAAAAKTPASTPGNIPSRLAAAWMLRDRLAARTNGATTPVDFAPHLWRQIESQLLQCERQYRVLGPFVAAESDDKSKPPTWPRAGLLLSREVDDVLRLMRAVGLRKPLDAPPVTPLERDVTAWFAAVKASPAKAESDGDEQAAELDRILSDGSLSEFTAWAAKLSNSQPQLAELHLARRLTEAGHLNWSDIRLALTARRYAEQVADVAADEWAWVGNDVLEADRFLNAAERQLLDGVGEDFRQRFRSILVRGVQQYASIADRLRVLRTARQTCHTAAFRAADAVRWQHATDIGPAGQGPSAQQVRLLLTTLKSLFRALDEPSPSGLKTVQRLTGVLRRVHGDLSQGGHDAVRTTVERVAAGRTPLPGDRLRLHTVLRLPFLPGDLRLKALQAADRLSRSERDATTYDAGDWHGPDRRIISHDDSQKLLTRAELDVLLAEAAVPPAKDGKDGRAPVRSALGELEKVALSGTTAAKLWEAHRRLATSLRSLRGALPQELTNAVPLAGVESVLRRGRILVELPQSSFDMTALLRQRKERRSTQRIAALAQRIRSALNDATAAESRFLTSAAGPLATPAIPIDMQSPDSVSLVDVASETVTVRIRNLGTLPLSLKAVVEYDGRLLDVDNRAGKGGLLKRGTDPAIGRRTTGRLALDSAFDAASEVSLPVAATHELQLTLHRKNVASSQPTRLIVHVKTSDPDARSVRVAISRRSTAVDLPSAKSIELLVRTPGIDGPTVGREHGQTAVHPFPNRKTEFQFQLRSLRRVDRTVDVQLLVPGRALPLLPPADLSPADLAVWRDRMGGLKLLAEQKGVKLPGDGTAVRVKPKAVAPAPSFPSSSLGTRAGARLDFGLLVLIRDQRSGKVAVRPVRISVQRPRRYVVPEVAFNAQTRRLDIRITPRNTKWLPSGPVAVQCEIVPKLPDGVDATLGGILSAEKNTLHLFAIVPEQLGRTVRLLVHVDGFPRSFVFQVPTDRNAESVAEDTARRAVRLIVDEKSRLVSGPAPKVAAKLEVDAPVGAFAKGDDHVDIGVDAARDRKLDGDLFRRLPSDRNAVATVEELTEEGGLVLNTSVADWTVDVSLKDYRNRVVNVLARLVAGGRLTYSNSVPVVADERPPVIEPLRNLSLLEGKPLDVAVLASDENLSGVEKIEVAVDPGTGQFAKDPPPSVATADNQGRWVARIPTDKLKAGNYRLLIRATDRAGNASEIVKARLQVLSGKDAETANQPKTNRVEGFVVWDGEAIPGATVTLAQKDAKKPTAIPPVTTDRNGEFQFPSVPPGKYVLTARKDALANKNRTVTLNLTVPEPPDTVPNQRVEFP